MALFKFCALSVLLIVFIGKTHSAKIPSYLKPCKKSDPDFNKCIIEHGNEAFPHVALGDESLNVPSIFPYILNKYTIHIGKELTCTLNDLAITGTPDTRLTKAEFDLDKKHLRFGLGTGAVEVIGNYVMDGKLDALNVRGKGKSNITFSNIAFTYDYHYSLEEKDGHKYAKTEKTDIQFECDGITFDFENLFEGNSELAVKVNTHFNVHWKDIMPKMKDSLNKLFKLIFTDVFEHYMTGVPIDELFEQ